VTTVVAPTVVALGQVDPELVVPHLPSDVTFVAEPTEQDLAAAAGAVVRADAVVDRAMLDRMPKMRVLARTGVGVDAVDVEESTRRGIAVVITPGSGTNAVAEGTLAMVLHLVKRLTWTTALVAEGRWADRSQRTLGDLDGATIGIVGYGRIGRRVGHLAQAFGMTVVAYDPFAPATPELVELAELRRRADVITLHLPLTDSTHHLVDAEFLGGVKAGTVLVNCGRGGLLDLDAAAQALADGRLSGLGLDTFDPEPPAHHPVFDRDDVVLSPHVMGLSAAATRDTFAAAARGVADVLTGRPPAAVVNPAWTDSSDPLQQETRS
jgi:D-3-phosphoglycerate dehydrogenase